MKCYVLMVSRYFAKDHKNAGLPTFFVEKICKAVGKDYPEPLNLKFEIKPKRHTVRLNYELWAKRFEEIKQGKAYLSLRYWLDAPYKSPQHEFLRLEAKDGIGVQKLSFPLGTFIDDVDSSVRLVNIAENDGLDFETFKDWFGEKLTANNGNEDLAIIHFTNFRYENSKTATN